jgi:Protein of unknown function (DUF1360)
MEKRVLNFFDIVIASFGVWRLAHMLKYEAGPWDMFIRIREKLGNGILGKLMDCVWCSSVWLAIIFFVPGIKILVIVLAISALAIFLELAHGLMLRTEYGPDAQADGSGTIPRRGANVLGPRGHDKQDIQI